jgi:hypothetical protein
VDSVLGVTSSVRRGVQNSGRGKRADGDCGIIVALYEAREKIEEEMILWHIYTPISKKMASPCVEL